MGLWPDAAGNGYVAVFAGQAGKRVSPKGAVEGVARSDGRWSTVAGTFAADGALVLLEFSSANEARIRGIAPGGAETIF